MARPKKIWQNSKPTCKQHLLSDKTHATICGRGEASKGFSMSTIHCLGPEMWQLHDPDPLKPHEPKTLLKSSELPGG